MATSDELAARLAQGEARIAQREREQGGVPASWLDRWLDLLRQYEDAVDTERGTCPRRPRQRGARAASPPGRYVERRLPSLR